MKLQDLNGKRVCMLGYGREGKAVISAIERLKVDAKITVADQNEELRVANCDVRVGPDYLKNLEEFDVIIKSPGIPHSPEIDAVKNKMTTATNIFFDSVEGTGALIIGITGSKGKSTTSTLIFDILKAAGKDAYLVGNIGKPALDQLEHAKPGAVFVHETSSYQLLDMTVSPHVSVVTSFFPEHLDYHGSLEAYRDAKKHICEYQSEEDMVFFPGHDPGAVEIAKAGNGRKLPFLIDDCPVELSETKLIGDHNRSNIAGAFMVCTELGIDPNVAITAIKNFTPLPHRLQPLGVISGIEWIDDAISTTPESAIAALDALGDRVATVILGGQDRGNDFSGLAARIKNSAVKTVILFPGSGPRIREAIGDAQADVCFQEADSMQKAVEAAKKHTADGKICLLSTASPSYGMFKNFEEKGDRFQECIKKLDH